MDRYWSRRSVWHSAARNAGLLTTPPFRAPHHTISGAGLPGGGTGTPRPGEVSLAHNGVLFLDELPEFPRNVLALLRQPIEEGVVTLAFPARFTLAAAMNPCAVVTGHNPAGGGHQPES